MKGLHIRHQIYFLLFILFKASLWSICLPDGCSANTTCLSLLIDILICFTFGKLWHFYLPPFESRLLVAFPKLEKVLLGLFSRSVGRLVGWQNKKAFSVFLHLDHSPPKSSRNERLGVGDPWVPRPISDTVAPLFLLLWVWPTASTLRRTIPPTFPGLPS